MWPNGEAYYGELENNKFEGTGFSITPAKTGEEKKVTIKKGTFRDDKLLFAAKISDSEIEEC